MSERTPLSWTAVPVFTVVGWLAIAAQVVGQTAQGAVETAQDRQRREPRTREYAEQEGRRLLFEGKWQEAAEAFGLWFSGLADAVDAMGIACPHESQPERDRFHFGRLNLYFYSMSYPNVEPRELLARTKRYANQYQEILSRLGQHERQGALDFSHLELWESIMQRDWEQTLTEADRERVIAAVKSHPNSVPAVNAMVLLLSTTLSGKQWLRWEEAEALCTSTYAKLVLARAAVAWGYRVHPELLCRIVEQGLEHAPSSEEKAKVLYEALKRRGSLSPGRDLAEHALEVARRITEQFPETATAAEAWRWAIETLLEARRPDEALALLRKLQQQSSVDQRVRLDCALFALSESYFAQAKYDRSEELLRELVRDYPGTDMASRAMLELAKVFAARKDTAEERYWLLKCVRLEKAKRPGGSIMEIESITSSAAPRLAASYERDGQWADALHWWQAWKPGHWCGTCCDAQRARRQGHIILCQLHLRRYRDAVHECLKAIRGSGWVDRRGEWSVLMFELYRQADQIDDLLAIADRENKHAKQQWLRTSDYYRTMKPEELEKRLPMWPIHRLKDVFDLEQRKDFEALVNICLKGEQGHALNFDSPGKDFDCKAAAEALARGGDESLAALRVAIQDSANRNRCGWLLYALTKHPSPEAFGILRDFVEQDVPLTFPDHLAAAIALKGEAGVPLLERMAKGRYLNNVMAAQQQLRSMITDGARGVPWPAPPRGSLPKWPDAAIP